ncbi:MAG TPA: oligosaccharide flippase family protein [Candidatus Acidoferrum sp.]|nr:oligosaccharide flippase family protein [Candidatus Acidoferrum sp.]
MAGSAKREVGKLIEAVLGAKLTRAGEEGGAPGRLGRQLVTDAFNYFLSKVVPGLMGFLSVLVFVRMVGVEQYGRYAVIFGFVMASAAGLAGWLSQGIIRFQSQWGEPAEAASFLHSAVAGTILSVVVGGIILGIAIPAFGLQKGWPLLISLALFGVLLVYTVRLARFQASLRSGQVLRIEAVRSVGCFFIPIALFWITGSRDFRLLLLGIALGYSLPLLEPALSQARLHAERGQLWLSVGQRKVLSELWAYGWPVGVWSMCLTLQSALDRFFIQRFSGDANAGSYAAMYDVIVRSFSLLCFPLVLSANSLVMSRWNKGDKRGAISVIASSLKYQTAISIVFLLALGLLTRQVSHAILGRQHEANSSLVLPLAFGGFLWQISYLVHKPLELMCLTKRMLAAMIIALAVSGIGNYLFIPVFGYPAAAYMAMAAPAAYLIIAWALTPLKEFRREISVSTVPLVVQDFNQCD